MSCSSFNCRFVSQGCKNNNGQGYNSERGRNRHEIESCFHNLKSKNYGKDQKASEERPKQHINKSTKTKTFEMCLLGDEQQKIQIKPK